MTGSNDRLGVVIVHYGPQEPTYRCLRSIMADATTATRVVVLDNGPVRQGRRRGWTFPENLEASVLACPYNPGFGGAANLGVEALNRLGPLNKLVILNNDVEILPGFLAAAAGALDLEGVGAAGGPIRLVRPSGDFWYAGGHFRRLTGTVTQSHSPADARRARDVGFVPGTAMAVSREAWENVGGFDPRFFLYHEDLDLCLRLRRAGWRLRFVPEMVAVHHLGGATGSNRLSALYLEEMAATRFRPHPSRLYRLYLALLHTPYVLMRALKLMTGSHGGGAARARALLAGHRRALRRLFD